MRKRLLQRLQLLVIVGMLASCASRAPLPTAPTPAPVPPDNTVRADAITHPKSRWVPVPWSELPGWNADTLYDAWNAWIRSCEKPAAGFAALCADVRRLSIASEGEQRAWMVERLQPYRVESLDGAAEGLLTSYYEPVMVAARKPGNGYNVPLYRTPASLGSRKPWYTRQQIDTLPQVRAELQGREIAWLADPVEAMALHIQGSGRLRITEADGSQNTVRVAFAGTNDQPYKSIGTWLLQQGATRDASWPGIRDWLTANPQRQNELLWQNPRYVFFREEALTGSDAAFGPRGAQGVALTPGRSIAVDRQSIPYGTPVWLATPGPTASLQRLVLAQDTGSAILGAVRADYFTGWGPEAGDIAGRLKQNLRLWALWPK